MKRMTSLTGLVVVAAAYGAGGVWAQDKAPNGKGMKFEHLDIDGDLQISREEIAQRRNERFSNMDSDGDGKLTLEEVESVAMAQAKARAAAIVERFDKDGDGALSADELPWSRDGGGRMFDRLDRDGDGVITREEFDAAQLRKGHSDRNGKMDQIKKQHKADQSGQN
ncbi:EF-hand domain-containing protein [Pontibaca salina]|uniref:EF-hand domain-containing protein n=1 Tax=Pontibaca salina TaxID=2795731 RepID=A0A934HQS5_9RHOB|nr:EF-hand domain-containing protein [Pontibaca salina]MBI6630002.1 EF-hand domain-containing protein [Pontibaca salina]